MNNRGFTLVEILAMLVVLGVLMAITIPNITGIMNNNKLTITYEDANKLVESAKTQIVADRSLKLKSAGDCIVFTMDYLDRNDDFKMATNGGTYDKYASFVVARRVDKGSGVVADEYYVRLVEVTDDAKFGIELTNIDLIVTNPEDHVGEIKTTATLKGVTSEIDSINTVNSLQSGLCTNSRGYFK